MYSKIKGKSTMFCVLNGPLCLTHYAHACMGVARRIYAINPVTINTDISVQSLKAARKKFHYS